MWRICVMSYKNEYQKKLKEAHDVLSLIKDGDTIIVPTGVGEPPTILTALSEQRRNFNNLKITQVLPLRDYGYYDPETVDHIRHASCFLGGPSRRGAQEGWVDYIPNYFYEIPMLMRHKLLPSEVVVTMASPMDKHGFFSISLGTDYTIEAIKNARVVILEVNPHVPFSYGDCHVHISQVTAIVEDESPLLEVGLPVIGETEKAIGKSVADMIPNGSTLQIGYGAIPDAVVMQLLDKEDLGIHTEMIGDGIMSLIEAGVVTNRRKNYLPNKMVATFALGSKRLYEFMDRNPVIEMHPVSFTNDPYIAGKNDNLISINGTMQVDLLGQCGSEGLGHTPYSGTGGQADFVRAANRSEGGVSLIVMPSTAKGDTISRIVLELSPGTPVSTGKNDVSHIVTEYGVARLRGKTARARAEALIAIAHPKFRDELREQAKAIKVI